MPVRCHASSRVHEGRVFTLYHDRLTLPNGVETTQDVIRHRGAAAVVPVTRRGRVLLIRQYRYAVDDWIWEIPAGTIEADESPEECARRELVEEVGCSAARWQPLGVVTPLPAYSDERIHLYRAEDLRPAEQRLDPDELLEIHEVAFAQAREMIRRGEICDAKTICGLTMAGWPS